jgi:competence protein ComEC
VSERVPTGPLVVLAGTIVGIVAGEALGPAPARGALCFGAAGVIAAARVRTPVIRVLVAMIAFALLGTGVMQRALHGLVVSPLTTAVAARADGVIAASLVDDPDGARFDARVLVRVVRASGADAGGRRVLVRAIGTVAARVRLLSAGDTVTLRGWFEPLAGFDTRWRWRHAVGTFHATELKAVGTSPSLLARAANIARAMVLAGSERLAPADRALLAGFLLGDTRGVPDDVTERFRAAGLTHLTAVSGENVAFVLALFAPLLRRFALRGRLIGGVTVLLFFGTMTRWEPSVLRAIAMAVIALMAGYLGRPATGLRVLRSPPSCSSSWIPFSCTRWASSCRARPASVSRCSPAR